MTIINPNLLLANSLTKVVRKWSQSDYPPINGSKITDVTRTLLNFWFNQENSPFYDCQKEAIETIIYCYEILDNPSISNLYKYFKINSENLQIDNLNKIDNYAKLCLKMATGTGKTWIIIMTILWQYFNRVITKNEKFANHFLIVTPGLIVYERLLNAFLGKVDSETGKRNSVLADFNQDFFYPSNWKEKIQSLKKMSKDDIHPSMEISDNPFILITNWHRLNFNPKNKSLTLWDTIYQADIKEDESITEILKSLLTSISDLIILNDEAHHVHDIKDTSEKVWQESINYVYEKSKSNKKSFCQIDFSATPFVGQKGKRTYFPHIVYDYDVVKAMNNGLVKQIFLEERNKLTLDDLSKVDDKLRSKLIKVDLKREDIRAIRDKRTNHPFDLSLAQKLLIQIGLKKLEQLEEEWESAKISKKPILFILAEDNDVANLIEKEIGMLPNRHGNKYRISTNDVNSMTEVITIHSDRKGQLSSDEYIKLRNSVFEVDKENNPIKIIISVMMLKEGFDVNNICVIVGLRALDSDVLAEQTIGRGLRLMFREPEYELPKSEAMDNIMKKERLSNSFDQLFIVEHPAFRDFYNWIEQSGGHISKGDSSKVPASGDFIHVEVTNELLKYDIAWPEEIITDFSDTRLRFDNIDLSLLERWPSSITEMKKRAKVHVSESHLSRMYKAKNWDFTTDVFDYNQFLRAITEDVIETNKITNLSNYGTDIMGLIDNYCCNYLFNTNINYDEDENFTVLNILEVYDFVKTEIRKIVWNFALSSKDNIQKIANWKRLSEQGFWKMRMNGTIETSKCIYNRLPFTHGAGLERQFTSEILEKSPEVLAYSKINQFKGSKHMYIKYLSEDGHYSSYFPDFLVKTKDSIYIIETKSDKDFQKDPDVVNKAINAKKLCELYTGIKLPFKDIQQPEKWEYLIIPETRLKDNIGLSFDAIVELSKNFLDILLSKKKYSQKQELILKKIFQYEDKKEKNVETLIKDRENSSIERKSSFRFDTKLDRPNPKLLEKIIAKTVQAFMNGEGGILFIGVDDEGNVLGLEKDYQTLKKKNSDGFEIELRQSLEKNLNDKIVNELVEVNFHNIDKHEICEITVKKSPKPIILTDEGKQEFYVRIGNSSKPYSFNEFYEYCNRRFKNQNSSSN